MKKSEVIEQIIQEIKICEEHKCDDKKCQIYSLGVLTGLRSTKDVLSPNAFGQVFLKRALVKHSQAAFRKMDSDKSARDVLESLGFVQGKGTLDTDLHLKLLGYSYQGLVLLNDNVQLEALEHHSDKLEINESVWKKMTSIYERNKFLGMCVVIFREYEQGVRIVDQYVNYKLLPEIFFDLKMKLQLKYNL